MSWCIASLSVQLNPQKFSSSNVDVKSCRSAARAIDEIGARMLAPSNYVRPISVRLSKFNSWPVCLSGRHINTIKCNRHRKAHSQGHGDLCDSTDYCAGCLGQTRDRCGYRTLPCRSPLTAVRSHFLLPFRTKSFMFDKHNTTAKAVSMSGIQRLLPRRAYISCRTFYKPATLLL